MNRTNRRRFAKTIGGMAALSVFPANLRSASKRAPRILVRSSWQTVNIGDIAHTPGILKLLETHLPEAEIWLWPSKIDNGVDQLLRERFPKVRIVQGAQQLKAAFADCDFLLHGSGPSLVAEKDVVRWSEETSKPYGVYGITISQTNSSATQATSNVALEKTVDVLSKASFVFFRDSVSMEFIKGLGCTCPIMQFGPDAAFATDLRDEPRANAFLTANRLETGKFLCCIPRLRYTPYWTIGSKNTPFDEKKHSRNEAMKEHDHAQLREAIIRITSETDLKVLVCPEDQTQMAVGKEVLVDRLPETAISRVVWKADYWLTGEALSIYTRSAGLFGNEMHSPIMCIGNGVPAIVCRWAEQTTKGMMWRDIGLTDWLFDLDVESDLPRIAPTVMSIATQPSQAKERANRAKQFVEQRQRETMAILADQLKTIS